MRRLLLLLVLLVAACDTAPPPTEVVAVLAPNRIIEFWQPVSEAANPTYSGQPWQFVAQAGDAVHLTLTSQSAGVTLNLLGPDSATLDGGNDIRATLPSNGVYSAVVRFTPGDTATYTLLLEYTDRLDPSKPTPTPTITPSITPSPTPTITPTPTPIYAPLGTLVGQVFSGSPISGSLDDEETHVYLFSGQGGQYATVRAARESGTVDPFLTLYDPLGQPVASDDNTGDGNEALLRNILLSQTGDYILRVSAAGRGDYRLGLTLGSQREAVTPVIPEPTPTPTASPTAEPQPDRLGDHVPVTGRIASAGDFVRYPIVALQGEMFTVGVSPVAGSSLRPILELYTPSGELSRRGTGSDSGAGGDALVPAYVALESGTYLAYVLGDANTTGEFVISFGRGESREDIPRGDAAADTVLTGEVTRRGLRDVWSLYLNRDDVITIAASPQSATFDPLIELVAPDGTVMARDDNSGGGRVPQLNSLRAPQTGRYSLRVMAAGAGSSGVYTLVWRYVAAAPTVTPPFATVRILTVDGEVPERTYLDYPFQGQTGQRLLIRVTARPNSGLDPVVAVVSATGETLARADDNGTDLNPVLEFALPASGTYFIRVDGYQSSGRFDLTVDALY
jgi:hypothetical protein